MQIPTSAGMLTNSVLPVTPAQGVLLSQVGETAGSTSFAPIEAVSTLSVSREVPEQRPLPNFAPENGGQPNLDPAKDSLVDSVETRSEPVGLSQQKADGKKTKTQKDQSNKEKDGRDQGDSDLVQRQQNRQEQQDLKVIRQLSQRDKEVRAHEQAHSAVGGQYAGAAQYRYQRGPDGVNYAVAGEVPIDVGPINGDPRATLAKMQIVQRAALAPAEPSAQDRRVAALAAQQANQARVEIVSETRVINSSEDNNTQAKNDLASEKANVKVTDESASENEGFKAFNDRIAKINEILLAISQNAMNNASGQLLDDVV
jgi:hypothetical protein